MANSLQQIKAVAFDYGGVISLGGKWNPLLEGYANELGLNSEDLVQQVGSIWNKARVGEIDSNLFWTTISELTNKQIKDIQNDFFSYFGINRDVLTLAGNLKSRGIKTAILSNQIKDWFENESNKYQFPQIFDEIITSYEVGYAKPERQIYEHLSKKLELDYAQILLIDDQEKCIIGAEKLGMPAILFDNIVNLKSTLQKDYSL